jgi:hypothetical protein
MRNELGEIASLLIGMEKEARANRIRKDFIPQKSRMEVTVERKVLMRFHFSFEKIVLSFHFFSDVVGRSLVNHSHVHQQMTSLLPSPRYIIFFHEIITYNTVFSHNLGSVVLIEN